jgi:hypothetical protein
MIFRQRGEPYGNYPQYGNHPVFYPPPTNEEEDRRRRQHQEEESERARQAEQAKFAEEMRNNFRQREEERQAAEQARYAAEKAREKERERDRARRAAKARAKAEEQQQAVAEAEAPRAPTPQTVPEELSSVETVIEPTTTPMHEEGNNHMATATTTKTDAADTKTSAAIDWTKRAFSAGAEGAKDGAALVAAETLTAGVIAAISVEAPVVLTIYNNNALAQKLLQVLVPYSLGLAATMGWLPQSEMVAQLAERALRAAISGNIGPLFARFKLPIMRVVESAMRDTADADRFSSLGQSNGS